MSQYHVGDRFAIEISTVNHIRAGYDIYNFQDIGASLMEETLDKLERLEPKPPEALPCPFCGRDQINIHENDNGTYLECVTCGACGPIITKTRGAIELWNNVSKAYYKEDGDHA